ncbi:LysM peptidoglycan-binding domain-containing protein [Burkholderia cepacia]|uniref:peptidoglycan DD-metalloendopeptidase family protein n=1 Tax=Burkholderia TaxID=32008 RepID=UPI000F5979F4|nr:MULTISPECIES: peptidoglycan DD-metalloendopeptidase family protein [Burkholderia]MBY4801239.1 peptidoglycan DD-metalloendopeptidase family protein [Burkholderia cepacia]MCA7901126.1 peptidoglycan DD-metalloendopeptidase family protein [Burkholderia cepacia]MCA8328418.1 peptidoglycan DD-metalloendopeptidase family protein [Burkholderia cepacia]RQT57963.1 LysM peptidoglycan-binding domain-containing protein [Burkholderia cepacia]THJ55293.1 LysM peptidoglycan-binding domain-containing protein 
MSMLRAMQNNRSREPLTLAQRAICVAAFSTLLAACATRLDNAPVVDRSGSLGTTAAAQPAVPLPPAPPGYYRVKPGDTLYRIALENGQNYRDIAAWNNLANPNQIEVDQLLRVSPQAGAAVAGTQVAAPIGGAAVATAPLSSGPATPAAGTSSVAPPPAAAAASSDTATAPSGPVTFAWPARGPVLNGFDDAKNKGVNIGGTAGEAVKAAADGRVVYSGNGLRGYGNLIIIKHDATYLTAYAHNRALMVKEGDAVTKGQKIAEMGNSDSDRVMLHFEVRRQGKPVDPLKYLPPQ